MITELRAFYSDVLDNAVFQANAYATSIGAVIHSFNISPQGAVVALFVKAPAQNALQQTFEEQEDVGDVPVMQAVWRGPKGERKPAYVMSGVFGVPIGAKFAQDDTEPALRPLMSPKFNVRDYAKWLTKN